MLRKWTAVIGLFFLTYLLSSTVSAQGTDWKQKPHLMQKAEQAEASKTAAKQTNQGMFFAEDRKQAADEASDYTFFLHGEEVDFENPPRVENRHLLVEFRTIFESLGYEVDWVNETKTAVGMKDGLHIQFPVGKAEVIINGEFKTMPVATRVINGRTMIPLEVLVAASGYAMEKDDESKVVYVSRDLSEQISLNSNLTLNGYVEVSGTVSEQIQHVRLDISHTDNPQEIENVFLEPQDQVIQQSILLPGGPGIYSVSVFVTTDDDRYGSYRLLHTYTVAYAEHSDLLILPDNQDRNRYTIRARLSEQAESALLKIKKLDREAFIVVPIEDIEAMSIEQTVYLSFGPGVYQVDLFELYEGNQSIRTVTLTHQGNATIDLSTTKTDNSQVQISGKVSPDMKWMWVQYAKPTESLIRNAFVPIEDGKLEHTLHLNMGKGLYQVTIGLTDQDTYNQGYTTYETFTVENLDTRNRHQLPSETIQSHATSIMTKADDITAEVTGTMEKSRAIYEWIAEHIELIPHSGGTDQVQTATAVLEQGEAGSAGMARLSAAMHRAIGIPAKVVSGEALVDEEWQQHYWTEAFVEGRWVVQDTSWSTVSDYGEDRKGDPETREEIFDPDKQQFAEHHQKAMDLLE